MIFYSKELLYIQKPNIIMLDMNDDLGHIYVSRGTYDQAVIIADRNSHQYDVIAEKLGSRPQEDLSSYMFYVLPDPINCLSPFYNLLNKEVKIDQNNLLESIGVLSFISMSIDFVTLLTIPPRVRASLVFTPSIMFDYKRHYDDFVMSGVFSNITQSVIPQTTPIGIPIVQSTPIQQVIQPQPQNNIQVNSESNNNSDIDVDKFFEDIGFDDIKIPEIKPSKPKVEESSSKSFQVDEKKQDKNAYDDIISMFSR